MRLELLSRKRKIDELSEEVEKCKRRSDEIEHMITIIDRAWLQVITTIFMFHSYIICTSWRAR